MWGMTTQSPFASFPASISHKSWFKRAVTAGTTAIASRGLKIGGNYQYLKWSPWHISANKTLFYEASWLPKRLQMSLTFNYCIDNFWTGTSYITHKEWCVCYLRCGRSTKELHSSDRSVNFPTSPGDGIRDSTISGTLGWSVMLLDSFWLKLLHKKQQFWAKLEELM